MIAVRRGYVRWSTTTYWIDETAIHHHTGLLRERDTKVPLERVEGLDVHQGPLQRAFGVFAVDVQTGAAKKGGEIALPALTRGRGRRAARASGCRSSRREETGRSRRLSGRELAVAALTAGQLGIVLPVVAALGQVAQQVGEEEQQGATRFLPHSVTAAVLIVLALLLAAWVLSTLGSVVAFGGFTIVREQDRIRIRRGLVSRNEATVPVGRVRAVRVVEGVFRRPFGLCALTVEVTGYADEASAARTIFPLVRVREVRAFLEEFLPELADDAGALSRPPARAARRYLLLPVLLGVAIAVGAWFLVGVFALIAAPLLTTLYGWARWRPPAGACSDGRLAVRALRIARVTVLAPARLRESHTYTQNLFQRRAGPRRPERRVRQEHDGAHPPPRGGGCARGVLEQPVAHGRVTELEAGRDRARPAGRTPPSSAPAATVVSVPATGPTLSVRPESPIRVRAKLRSRIGTRAPPLTCAVSWRRIGSM